MSEGFAKRHFNGWDNLSALLVASTLNPYIKQMKIKLMNKLPSIILIIVLISSCSAGNEDTGETAQGSSTAEQKADTLQQRTDETIRETISIYDRILND